jgi:hypothetical protein
MAALVFVDCVLVRNGLSHAACTLGLTSYTRPYILHSDCTHTVHYALYTACTLGLNTRGLYPLPSIVMLCCAAIGWLTATGLGRESHMALRDA